MTCFIEQSQNQGTMDTRIGKWIVALQKASPQGEWEKKIYVLCIFTFGTSFESFNKMATESWINIGNF